MATELETWSVLMDKEIKQLQETVRTNGGNRRTAKIDSQIARELNKLYLDSLQLKWKHTRLNQMLMEREELYKLEN